MKKLLLLFSLCCFAICGLQVAKSGEGLIHDLIHGARPDDIQETNKARKEIGLRLIDTNWFFDGMKYHSELWKKSTNDYLCKVVTRDQNHKVISETDNYYSGSVYTNAFGKNWEFLAVMYSYTNGYLDVRYVGTNTTIHAMVEPYQYHNTNLPDAFGVADKVLQKWNQSRL